MFQPISRSGTRAVLRIIWIIFGNVIHVQIMSDYFLTADCRIICVFLSVVKITEADILNRRSKIIRTSADNVTLLRRIAETF
jgi:hypothetical protein